MLREGLASERSQSDCEASGRLRVNDVDIQTTLGQESTPSHGMSLASFNDFCCLLFN